MVQDDYEDYVHNLAKEHNLTPKEISILREQAQTPWAGATIAHLRFEALLRQFKSMRKICPKCGSSKGLREFIYGMPEGPVDEGQYEIGGCTEGFAEDSPTHRCIDCEWEGIFPSQ